MKVKKEVLGLTTVEEAIENFANSSQEARKIVERCKLCEESFCGIKLNCSYIGRESECPLIQKFYEERNYEK